MIRLASWLVFSLIIAVLIAWITALPGTVLIEVLGYRAEPRLGVAILLGVLVVVLVAVLVWLVARILATPGRIASRRRLRRREQGVEALSDGYIALEAGDPGRARALARDAQSRLPNNEAARLLEARAELALGNMPAAREQYRALIASEKTALAALSGLFEQARAQRRPDAALTFARKALVLSPGAAWASEAVFEDLVRQREWAQAVAMINNQPATTRDARARKRRIQAVIETARARELETRDPVLALEHALQALKLLPDFVPAALIAARLHTNQGDVRKAMSLLRRVWRTTDHPHAALLFSHAQPGASALERLKRMRELVSLPPASHAGAMVLARAAIDAQDWVLAREALAGELAEPSDGVCSLMAEIEEGDTGDQGKARAWLARAMRAPRDPQWTADGVVSDEWEPVSPVTGRLDAFAWKVPVSVVAVAAPDEPADRADSEPEQERSSAPLPIAANPVPL